mgnify:CR=1 FL=1
MTDTSGFPARVRPSTIAFDPASGPLLTEKHWGFTIRNTAQLSSWTLVSQIISFFLGAVFIAAALGIWASHDALFQSDPFQMRLGISFMSAAMGVLFIHFANKGTVSELQFDLHLGEVREVMQNRTGKMSLVAHFGLDAFAGLAIDRSAGNADQVQLIMRHNDGVNNIIVAQGTEAQIGALFGRLDRDLLRGQTARDHAVTGPEFA